MQLTQYNLTWEPVDETTYSIRPEYLVGEYSLLNYFPEISSWLKENNYSYSSWIGVLATLEKLEQWSQGSLNSMAGKKDGLSYIGYESLRERFKIRKTMFERTEVYQGEEVIKTSSPKIDHPFTRTFSSSGSYKHFKGINEVRGFFPLSSTVEKLLKHRNELLSSLVGNRVEKHLKLRRADARVVKITIPKFILEPEGLGFTSKAQIAEYLGISESTLRKDRWKNRIENIATDKSKADKSVYGIEIGGYVLFSEKERFRVNTPGYCIPINIEKNEANASKPSQETTGNQDSRYGNEEQTIKLKIYEQDLLEFLDQLIIQQKEYESKSPEQKLRSLKDVQDIIKGFDVYISVAGTLESHEGIYQTDIIYQRSLFGRFYSTHKNNPFNPQQLKREHRKALFKSQYSYDIDACHPRILIALAERLGIPAPSINEYVSNKSEYRSQIASDLQSTEQFVKDTFNAAVNGSRLSSPEFKDIREHSLVKSFIREVQSVLKRIDELPEYTDSLKDYVRSKKLPFVLQHIESEVMKMVREKYPDMTLLIHDGFYGLTDAQNTIKEVEEACLDQSGAYIKFN